MKIPRVLIASFLVGTALTASFYAGAAWSASPPPPLQAVQRASEPRTGLTGAEVPVIELFEEAAPSVVFINTTQRRRDFFFNVSEVPGGSGSGIVWDRQGHIVTNYHVIAEARTANVTLADGTEWLATYVGGAREKDLAVLHIEAPPQSLSPIKIGTSHDLQVGQSLLAIGNPFGLDNTLTTGIVSALGRQIESSDGVPIRDVIQTDAAINPGNSGGPLLDSAGRLIGVNTAIVSPSGAYAGIGFAIPINTVNWVVADLIAYGRIVRPSLGLEFFPINLARRASIDGAVIYRVAPGGAADLAGLLPATRSSRGFQPGDIMLRVEGQDVRTEAELNLVLEAYEVGDAVTIEFRRGDEVLQVQATLQEPRGSG